ncbi:MAG TPA: ABC transporter ATP-binding protein, partial [Phycisphaerales bacterium]|nr:ABC transporter ATP-binding protein [Phycisphaerales bacterium]
MSFRELLATQRRIFGFILPYWKIAGVAIFFTVVVALLRLSQAKFIGWLFELLGPDKPVAQQAQSALNPTNPLSKYLPDFDFTLVDRENPIWSLKLIIGTYLIVLVARGVSSFCQKYLTDMAAQSAVRDLRARAFAHLQDLSMQFFESMRLGEIQSRCTS